LDITSLLDIPCSVLDISVPVPHPIRPFATDRAATGPHAGQPVFASGAPVAEARVAVVLVHGRGAGADDMLSLAAALDAPATTAFVAPQAAGSVWYPLRFLAPPADNEPWLSSGFDVLRACVETIERHGLERRRIVLLGFSQGGCLALHFGATHATRWGGLVGLSAGLIGPPGVPWRFAGALDGTPAFLGCSDRDPHIPETRLRESADALRDLGADVTLAIYPGLGHTVHADELARVRHLLERVGGADR
jgi:predicted esterase